MESIGRFQLWPQLRDPVGATNQIITGGGQQPEQRLCQRFDVQPRASEICALIM
jgi:hypothetical protein